MAKHVLNFASDYDFDVIAISSHIKDYKLCWHFNREMQMDFVLSDISVKNLQEDGSVSLHSVYSSKNEELKELAHLIPNTTYDGCLFPEYRNFTYLIILKNYTQQRKELFLDAARRVKNVIAALEINLDKLKNKEKLLFDDTKD